MNYIIEDSNVVSDQGISILSYLITDHKISHYGKSLKKYNHLRMNLSSYFMTPGHVITHFQSENSNHLATFKSQQLELIRKGCTTVLFPFTLFFENEFEKELKKARHTMINSTIDYSIGLHMPVEKITPTIIRLCKRHKLPFIFADIREETDLFSIKWGWLRDAQFQFQVPIYPLWKIEESKALHMQMDLWERLTSSHNIQTHLHFPTDLTPIPKVIRQQIGLYPRKGELLIGNDLDYNLYTFPHTDANVDESSKLDYDKIEPIITVHKGRLLKINADLNFFPGFGEELVIKMPGLFASIEHVKYSPHLNA